MRDCVRGITLVIVGEVVGATGIENEIGTPNVLLEAS
jgi:hypothetical protein